MNAPEQIHPAQRLTESRSFWPGFILCLAGLLLALFGLGRITAVEKVSGDLALETDVNMAIAHGGVQLTGEEQQLTEPQTEPAARAHATEGTLADAQLRVRSAKSRLRIDLSAKEPCPT